jgi:hypothetical protein
MWTLLLCAGIPASQDAASLRPRLEEVRLVVGHEQIAPVLAREGVLDEFSKGAWRIEMRADALAIARSDGEAPSKTVSWKGALPRVLALEGDMAWIVNSEAKAPTLMRLQLERGEWLPEWTLDDKTLRLPAQTGLTSTVTCVASYAGVLYALRRDETVDERRAVHLRAIVVARLTASGKPIWARSFACDSVTERPGAVLMAPMLTAPAAGWPIELQFHDGGLLVCARGSTSLMLLDVEKGKMLWSIDRLWEYQRGFIGPSTWRHILGRFGMHELQDPEGYTKEARAYWEERKRELDRREQAFRAAYDGAFAAGPFVVSKSDGYRETRVFVLVSVSPRVEWPAQLAQHYVYEIDDFIDPCSVLPVPHNAYGWAAAVDEEGFTLALSQGAWARFSSSERRPGFGRPGNSPDCTTTMPWYRELTPTPREAWMTCDAACDAVDVEPELGVRVAGGGWIREKGESIFHFPLWLLDPRTGATRDVELLAPFDGRVEIPESSKGKERLPIHTWGWNGLAISGLRLSAGRLLVWLGNGSQLWCVGFDASKLAVTE